MSFRDGTDISSVAACWLLFARQALLRLTSEYSDSRTADGDVHGGTPRNDRSRRRVLLNDQPSFVGGTRLPSHLAEPETDGGQLATSGCLPAIAGPSPRRFGTRLSFVWVPTTYPSPNPPAISARTPTPRSARRTARASPVASFGSSQGPVSISPMWVALSIGSAVGDVTTLKGTETSDWARDQVFLRVHSTCSASAATMRAPDRPPGETPVS